MRFGPPGRNQLLFHPDRKRQIGEAIAVQVTELAAAHADRRAEVVASSRGSTFYLCTLSAKDPTVPRYPQLPVLVCRGYEATG
jgi:hypothetical protein